MICNQCGQERGNRRKCSECNRRYQKKWYAENKDKQIERSKARENAIYRQVYDYLLEHPCVDCGLVDPVVMHFDHRDTLTKSEGVGIMISKGHSWKRLQAEIEKCDVRCANCHIRRTSVQFNWRKANMGR